MRAPWPTPPPPLRKAAIPPADEELETVGRSAAGARKKGTWVRTWMTVDAAGVADVAEAGKQSIMRRSGLPARDLRVLDPLLSYPSTVLGRERAIVVNLEHIKAVVTANEVLLLNYSDSAVESFVAELKRRLLHRHNRLHGRRDQEEGGTSQSADWTNVYDLEEPRSRSATPPRFSVTINDSGCLSGNLAEDDNGKGSGKSNSDGPKILPFEFVALEACLEAACSSLEIEATTLEKEAHPALDKLTSKISTLNLERVRQIKSRLVAITGRVQKVRDELEHLLDDDGDMAEMYLTDKLMQQNLSNGSSRSLGEQGDVLEEDRFATEISLEENEVHNNYEDNSLNSNSHEIHDRLLSGTNIIHGESHGTHTSSSRSGSKHLDVEELEMLLEAYFVQVDSTLNKLSTLREYVDDTEDYINIMLDDKQNHLLQMGVVMTTATLVVSAFVALVGIFGMNIQVDLFVERKSGMPEFWWTVGGGAAGSLLLYIASIAWCKSRRLLE